MGELTVLRGGVVQRLPASKKSRALLAYLVASGRAQLREQLCGLLWDGPDDPRAGLRWALSKIRPLLDGTRVQRLIADRDHIGFEAQGAILDLAALRAIAAAGVTGADTSTLTETVALFRGNFLEGLDLPGCHRFHAWCLAERESLRTLEIAVRSALLARHASAPQQALPHARALLALDPLAESSHIAVVQLLGELGRTREALEAYEQCRALLERELGARPSREMERARMRLGPGPGPGPAPGPEAGPAPEPPTATGHRPPATGPLRGRDDERALLARQVEAAAAGRAHQLLLLLGEAGVGKSRLLAELGELAHQRGGRLLAGKAFEAELVRPYGVWIEALRGAGLQALEPATRADLAPLFPDLAGPATSGDRARLFEAVRETVAGASHTRAPLVLVLDDLQWLDEASAALLHHLLRTLEGAPVLFACAAREGELGDNPAALRLCRTLDRDRRLLRMPLRPLTADASALLVRDLAGPADTDRVYAEAEGNPLYTIEIARALRATASAQTAAEHEPPATLESLIAERVDRLEPTARNLLPWAAALGRSFDPQILAAVSGLPLPELCATLDELERREVLRGAGAAGYDFTHDLIRRVIYHRMPDARRRLVHLHIARQLATLSARDEALAGELAHHAGLGGDQDTAARGYLRAGERCLRMFAWGEARELARRGLHEAEALTGPERLRLRLGLIGVEVLAQPSARRYPQVERELSQVMVECENAGLQAEVGQGFYLRSVIGFHREDWSSAYEATLRAADARSGADPVTRARSLADTARCLLLIERDVPHGRALLEQSRQLAPDDEMLSQCWGTALLARFTGDTAQAEQFLLRTLALVRAGGHGWEEHECVRLLAMLEMERGRPQAALEHCAELSRTAAKMTDQSCTVAAEALAAAAQLCTAGAAGDVTILDARLPPLRHADVKAMLAFVQNAAAEWELAFGDPARAGTRAEEALQAARAIDRKSQMVVASALLARVALQQQNPAAARRLLAGVEPALAEPLMVSAFARAQAARARQALPPG